MRMMQLAGQPLSLSEIAAVALRRYRDRGRAFGPRSDSRLTKSHRGNRREGGVVYGVSTGFGKLADVQIPPGNFASCN